MRRILAIPLFAAFMAVAVPDYAQVGTPQNIRVALTVSQLPAAPDAYNQFWTVFDGATASDCTTGGGTSGVMCWSNGATWTAIGGGSGGGGGTFAFPGVLAGVSATTSQLATYQQMATAEINPTTFNMLLSSTNPTNPGDWNVVEGYGAASHLFTGSGGDAGTGGQADVYVGYDAGLNATTQRESVVIGYLAGEGMTGSGLGPDDNIVVCIGSQSCGMTNTATDADVWIGQKAAVTLGESDNDVGIGTHTASGFTQTATSAEDTFVGSAILNSNNILNGAYLANTFLGYGGALGTLDSAGFSYDTCLGAFTCNILSTGSENTTVGAWAGQTITTGSNNVFLGEENPVTISVPGLSGTYNTLLNTGPRNAGGLPLTTGSNNFLGGSGSGQLLTTGSNNVLIGGGEDLVTGIDNLILEGGTATGSALSYAIIMGVGAGAGANASAANTGPIIIGALAGAAGITGTNDIAIGNSSTGMTSGVSDVSIGGSSSAGTTGSNDTAVGTGATACTTVNNCVAVGAHANAGTTGGSNVVIEGNASANALTSGADIVLIGTGAGTAIATGSSDTIVGFAAGPSFASATGGSSFGYGACQDLAAGRCTDFGYLAGQHATATHTSFGYNALTALSSGTADAAFGDSACDLLTGAESNDTCLGSAAEIAVGISGATEIGPGTCSTANALCINGVQISDSTGNLYAAKLVIAAARKGTFTCSGGGTITISNTNELVTSDVVISMNTAGGTITTPPAMKTVTSGTGFSVLCGATDTSVYNYNILD